MRRYAPVILVSMVLGSAVFAGPALERLRKIFESGVQIGLTGTTIDHSGAATSAYMYGDVLANTCAETGAITVNGASLGDTCEVGSTLATPTADAGTYYLMRCRVTATNTVKGKACAIGQNINFPDAGYKYRTFSSP